MLMKESLLVMISKQLNSNMFKKSVKKRNLLEFFTDLDLIIPDKISSY